MFDIFPAKGEDSLVGQARRLCIPRGTLTGTTGVSAIVREYRVGSPELAWCA